jgi:hypothetical protein
MSGASRWSAQSVMIGGSLARLSYASGLLLAPKAMSRWHLIGPDPPDPFARMTTRAFGALHANLALHTVRAAVTGRRVDFLLVLNLTSDFADMLGPTLEWRYGDLPLWAALTNAAIQSLGLATWSIFLLQRRPARRGRGRNNSCASAR